MPNVELYKGSSMHSIYPIPDMVKEQVCYTNSETAVEWEDAQLWGQGTVLRVLFEEQMISRLFHVGGENSR